MTPDVKITIILHEGLVISEMKFLKIRKSKLLVFVICITLMLSGCTNATAEIYQQTQNNVTQSSSTKAKSNKDKVKKEETTEIETKSNVIKKDPYYITDWSIDDVITNVEMNGVTYSMPFTFNDLGEGYTIEKINDELFLYYHGENYALIKVKDNSDIKNSEIISITISSEENFKLGDISNEDRLEDVLKKYGEPSLISSVGSFSLISYVFEGKKDKSNSSIGFTFKDNKLNTIGIIYNG